MSNNIVLFRLSSSIYSYGVIDSGTKLYFPSILGILRIVALALSVKNRICDRWMESPKKCRYFLMRIFALSIKRHKYMGIIGCQNVQKKSWTHSRGAQWQLWKLVLSIFGSMVNVCRIAHIQFQHRTGIDILSSARQVLRHFLSAWLLFHWIICLNTEHVRCSMFTHSHADFNSLVEYTLSIIWIYKIDNRHTNTNISTV